MRERFISYLSDPLSGQPLTLTIFTQEGEHIIAGLLHAGENWYPLINGIPRILIAELKKAMLMQHVDFFRQYEKQLPPAIRQEWQSARDAIPDLDAFLKHQKKTAESFAFEWRHIYRENNYEKENFLHFLSPFVTQDDLKGKMTLDIGCGSGRFTKWAALSGASVAFGSDLGESVEAAYQLTKDLPNVCIVQADIYAMPFRNIFDISYSIGVLHHLPRPEQGFAGLPKTLKPGGTMLIWVYNRRNNNRALYFYEPMRDIAKRLPKPFLYRLCYVPAVIVHGINGLSHLFNALRLPKLAKAMPFSYYANFPFNMKLNDAFDVLATPKSNYYRVEEVRDWFTRVHLNDVRSYEHPEAGITCVGAV